MTRDVLKCDDLLRQAFKKDVYQFLFVVTLILLIGCVVYLLILAYQSGLNREVVVVTKSTETAAFELFEKQYSHLLTTISLLIGIFGLALPLTAYFFQRENLKEERRRILFESTTRVAEIKLELADLKGKVSEELVNVQEIKRLREDLGVYFGDYNAFKHELAFRLGRHFFILGGLPSSEKADFQKAMCQIYALEQFSAFPEDRKSRSWIDSTLANILMTLEDGGFDKVFAHRWDYALETLKVLRRVSFIVEYNKTLRSVAREIAGRLVKKLPKKIARAKVSHGKS